MEKTEKATPRRRSEARKKGKVVHSQEVLNFGMFLACCIFFVLAAGYMNQNFVKVLADGLLNLQRRELDFPAVYSIMSDYALRFVIIILPFTLVICLFGIAANVVQRPFMVMWDVIKFNFIHIDPLAGIRRIFSYRYLIELAKSLLKAFIVGVVLYSVLSTEKERLLMLASMGFLDIFWYISKLCLKVLFIVTVIMAFFALLDYVYQRWQYEKDLMMTKEEVKDEVRQAEGDPQVRSRIRSQQKVFARKRMMEAVKKADVVITNPTHIAVALSYDPKNMIAPTVVAKGTDWLALKIRKVAEEAGVPVIEDRSLAQSLYKSVEVGQVIPVELYRAVAEVLAYVFRLKGKRVN